MEWGMGLLGNRRGYRGRGGVGGWLIWHSRATGQRGNEIMFNELIKRIKKFNNRMVEWVMGVWGGWIWENWRGA